MTESRRHALAQVVAGAVKYRMATRQGPTSGYYSTTGSRLRQAPYMWLADKGFIRQEASSLRGAAVVPIKTEQESRE